MMMMMTTTTNSLYYIWNHATAFLQTVTPWSERPTQLDSTSWVESGQALWTLWQPDSTQPNCLARFFASSEHFQLNWVEWSWVRRSEQAFRQTRFVTHVPRRPLIAINVVKAKFVDLRYYNATSSSWDESETSTFCFMKLPPATAENYYHYGRTNELIVCCRLETAILYVKM